MNKILSFKRFLILLVLIPFLFGGPAVLAEQTTEHEVQLESKSMDNRAKILQAYLSKHNSPMQYQSQDFIDAADQYDLDWKLVAAIAGTESTFGKHIPGGYNAWGWGIYGTQAIYFDSWRDGIFTVSEGLRKNYLNKGLNDPYAMNRVYAASPTWGAHVSFFLAEMEEFQKVYESKPALNPANNLLAPTAGTSANLAFKFISIDN